MGAYQLKNEELTLTVISAGAEMKSLKDNKTEQEYLWQADPKFWGRTSPVLFPIVGNYVQKQSVYEGKTYTLSQHGFARDMEFDLESQTEEEIWFVLKDTESTLEKYPFHFILKVGYRLSGRQVEVMWKVENPNDKKMYFSIGGHPAFNCPLKEGEKQEDCQLVFDTEGPLTSSILNEEGALCPRTKILNLFGKCLKLEEHLFDEDALIIENHQAQRIGLADADGKVYLEVEFDAPLFGIWSPAKKHAPFVCIEPWYGRSDREDFDHILENREWGNELEPGDIFETILVDTDEGPRKGITKEGLAKLRPAFKKDGMVTAGNASGINDGAAALIVMSEEKAKELGVTPMATWIGGELAGCDPAIMGIGPVYSTRKVMKKLGMEIGDFDLIEANEAFAAQSVAVGKDLGFDLSKLNVNGGAIALGHPVGCSGARILVSLLYEMQKEDVHTGLATLCVGGGMGCSAVVKRD